MATIYKYFKIASHERLRKVTISNPTKRNALSVQAYSELTGKSNKFAIFVFRFFNLN